MCVQSIPNINIIFLANLASVIHKLIVLEWTALQLVIRNGQLMFSLGMFKKLTIQSRKIAQLALERWEIIDFIRISQNLIIRRTWVDFLIFFFLIRVFFLTEPWAINRMFFITKPLAMNRLFFLDLELFGNYSDRGDDNIFGKIMFSLVLDRLISLRSFQQILRIRSKLSL